jgi:AP-1 complex subunit gamma-1
VALVTLKKVVQVDYNAVQRHRSTILECVKDHDISIRKGALDLLYQIINGTNIKSIVKELINILLIADSDFKNDLTSKVKLNLILTV